MYKVLCRLSLSTTKLKNRTKFVNLESSEFLRNNYGEQICRLCIR